MKLENALDRFYYSTALGDLKLMRQSFSGKNITYNSLLYLEVIYFMKGRATASKIAELLYVSKPAVTLKVNELIKLGFVHKSPDPTDKRRVFLSINEEMMPKYKIYNQQDRMAIQRIKEKYIPSDIHKFCDMLDIISEINLKEIE